MFSGTCLLLTGFLWAAPAEEWKTVVVVRDGNVVVRLKVLPRASLATADWLVLEFENTGRQPLPVDNAHYRIEREADDLRTGKLDHSGGLASGNQVDLFGEGRNTLPVGVYRNVRQVSDYSATLLGLPPATGWRVRAQLHLSLTLKDGRRIDTPEKGVPFTFEWHHPNEAGFAVMRQRLKQLLAAPENRPHHCYILDAHLAVPEVAQAVTRDDLLRALAGRKGSFDGRWSLLRELGKRYTGDPGVVAHFRDRLAAGDNLAVEDLTHGILWDASFGELVVKRYKEAPDRAHEAFRVLESHWDKAHARPLAELVATNTARYSAALETLAAHRNDWMADAKLAARVSAAVRKEFPLPEMNVMRLKDDELDQWARQANLWALTGDRKIVEIVRPALQDKRRAGDEQPLVFAGLGGLGPFYYPPVRVCDHALEAILIVLDGPAKAREKPTIAPGGSASENEKEASRVRDRMIAELERRLDK